MIGIAGLLVDLDGTLVSTDEANFTAYSDALAAVGVNVSRNEFDQVARGRNWRQFLPLLLAAAGNDADPALIAAHKAAIYPERLSLTVANDALVALIRTLRRQLRTALVTTASAANARAVIRHHAIEDLFDVIITGTDVARHKPDPEAYFLAAERLGLSPAECLIFEDSDIGVASAKAFGGRCLRLVFS